MADLLAHCLGHSVTMWIVSSPDGEVLDASPSAGVFVARPMDEVIGAYVWDFGPNLTRENFPEIAERALAGQIVEHEIMTTGAPVSPRLLRVRYEGVRGPEGEPLVLLRGELVEREQSAEALGDEYWFRCIARFGDDGFWAYDPRSGILVLNRQWYAQVGLPPRREDDLETLRTRIHPDDQPRLQLLFSELFSGRAERLSARLRLRHADGHYIWIRHRAYVVARDAAGLPTSIVGHDVNISVEVAAEQRARESELESRRLLERIPIAVLVYGPDGQVKRWNREAGRVLGVDAEDVPEAIAAARAVAWDLVDGTGARIPPDQVPIFEVFRTGQAIAGQVVGVPRDGGREWGLMSAVPGFDSEGQLIDVVCTVTDITESRKLEAGLARAQRLESLGRLASGVAHDFNNLLTVVVSAAEMLADEVGHDTPAAAEVAELQHAAQRGAELTRQLLGYARQTPPDARPLDLGRHVAAAAGFLRRLLPVEIELVTEVPEAVWPVRFDAAQFDQILVNLTVNAADAMAGRGGRLTIALHNIAGGERDRVRLQVSDTGCGMTEDVIGRAVEPFYTTKAVGAGTGLGLSTCFGLVRQHGGELRIRSVPGEGTTIEIDLLRTARPLQRSDPPPQEPVCSSGQRVLLVEDEAPVREATRRALSTQGYEVVIARDGLEAMRRIDEGVEPDVVITDVAMPGMDGPSLVRALHRQRPQLPVLFVSGHDDPTLGRHGIDRTGVEFLAKPYGPRELVLRLERLLQCGKEQSGAFGQTPQPPCRSRRRSAAGRWGPLE